MQGSGIAETSMGAQSPHTLKKRASPPPLLDRQDESPQKRSRKGDAAGKENVSRSATVQPLNDIGIKPPECGVITRIECENFMKLTRFHHRKSTVKKFHSKGHAEEMAAWLAYLKRTAKVPAQEQAEPGPGIILAHGRISSMSKRQLQSQQQQQG